MRMKRVGNATVLSSAKRRPNAVNRISVILEIKLPVTCQRGTNCAVLVGNTGIHRFPKTVIDH